MVLSQVMLKYLIFVLQFHSTIITTNNIQKIIALRFWWQIQLFGNFIFSSVCELRATKIFLGQNRIVIFFFNEYEEIFFLSKIKILLLFNRNKFDVHKLATTVTEFIRVYCLFKNYLSKRVKTLTVLSNATELKICIYDRKSIQRESTCCLVFGC